MADPTVRELIEVPKTLLSVRPRAVSHRGHRTIETAVEAGISGGELRVVIRLNEALAESFSIVLQWEPDRGRKSAVMRVNGAHGQHRNPDKTILAGPHLHIPQQLDAPLSADETLSFAQELPPENRILTHAWQLFCRLTRTKPNSAMAAKIAELHTHGAQVPFDEFDLE